METACSNDIVIAGVALMIAATTLINLVVGYYRHSVIMSDNQRLLHVIEGRAQLPLEKVVQKQSEK